jgi:hypothetical protein
MEMVDNMIFTRAVVKETLRYRPPVIMVPYVVKKDYPVTESYTIPKGKNRQSAINGAPNPEAHLTDFEN